MIAFKDYLTEQTLDEALITFGNGRPKFNQIIVLAGGAGSGKGTVIDKLIGIQGKHLDVDAMKKFITDVEKYDIPGIRKKVLDKTGVDVTKLHLKNPDDVSILHGALAQTGLDKMTQKTFLGSVATSSKDRLPNIIFDVTMKDEKKLQNISTKVQGLGYNRENIHIVWVVAPLELARAANKARPRVVHDDIVVEIHEMVAEFMGYLVGGNHFRSYMDGDVWIVFNEFHPELKTNKKNDLKLEFSEKGGSYVKEAVYIKIKEKGKAQKSFTEIGDEYIKKIKKYIPQSVLKAWEN
jgi:predicted kinase